MRLTDLNIENYGPHTAWNPGKGGVASGLNVIYGPNEAGKSAIRAFIRMVLFGRPRRPRSGSHDPRPFNYTHAGVDNGSGSLSMRTSSGGNYTVYRVEGGKAQVTGDESGGEDLLLSLIGRLDEGLYQNAFSISLAELQFDSTVGDKAIQDRIYSAGLGLGSISLPDAMKRLEDERSTATGLWSTRGGHLRTDLGDLRERRQELAQVAEALTKYEGLTEDIAAHGKQISELEERLQEGRAKELRYKSINDLRVAIVRKAAIESQLAENPEVAPFPPDGIKRLEELKRSLDSVREQINGGNVQAARSESELNHLGVIESFTRSDSEILRLLNRHDLYIEAARDLPRVELEADTAHREIAAGLATRGETWNEERLDGFEDQDGARRRVNQAGKKLGDARSVADRHQEASYRATTSLQDTHHDEAAVRRRIAQIENPPPESADELRNRQDKLERLRAAVAERSDSLRTTQSGRPDGARRNNWFVAAFRSLINALRRLFGASPRERTHSATAETPTAVFQSLDHEISRLAEALNIGADATERLLVEQMSSVSRSLEKRVELDREQFTLGEAVAEVERASEESARVLSALQESELELDAVEVEWNARLQELHLEQSLDLSDALTALGGLGALREKLMQTKKLHIRIGEMKDAIQDVEDKLAPILASADMRELEPLQAGQALNELGEKFRSHQDALASGETLRQTIDSWTKQRAGLNEDSSRLHSEIDSLLQAAGCSQGQEEEFRALGKAAEQRKTLEQTLGQLIEANPALEQADESGLKAEIDAATPEEIEAKRQALADEIKGLEDSRGELREAVGGLNQTRKIAEESDPTLEIQKEIDRLEQLTQEDAHRWGVLTVAKQILDAARTDYQSERQAPLMRKASDHFRRITAGAYERVEAIMGEEEIQVVESTGRAKPVTELSRGTAEQLYLAMRFAFIDEYVEHSEPVPVLMDDVLVNFDEKRSRAASEAIVEFSREHQVLLLTCHEGTVEGMKEAAKAARVGGPEIIRL